MRLGRMFTGGGGGGGGSGGGRGGGIPETVSKGFV